jgi:hypothetical protein
MLVHLVAMLRHEIAILVFQALSENPKPRAPGGSKFGVNWLRFIIPPHSGYDLPEFVSELLEVIASAKRRSWGSELRSTSGVERLPHGIGPDRQMPDARP